MQRIMLEDQLAQAVIGLLSDRYSRSILFSTTEMPKSVEEVGKATGIPTSTCYRRIHELLEQGILVVAETVLTNDGRKYETYKSAIKDARINMQEGKITIEVTPNVDAAGRLHNSWMNMKPSNSEHAGFYEKKLSAKEEEYEERIDLSRLVPENMVPLLRDCDVCRTQYVQCHTFYSTKLSRRLFVCEDCESKMSIRKQISV